MLRLSLTALLVALVLVAVGDAKPKRGKKANAQAAEPAKAEPDESRFKIEITGTIFDAPKNTPEVKPAKSPFEFVTTSYHWKRKGPKVRMLHNDDGFCFLTSFAGCFRGWGESVSLQPGADEHWYLAGQTQQPLAAAGVGVASVLRQEFEPKYDLHKWKRGQSAVKMIHSSEGFCFLASVAGCFQGYGEQVRVYINPDDGFWYLTGKSQQPLAGSAYSLRLRKGSDVKLKFTEHVWSRGKPAVVMLPQEQGFCFLASVSGNFAGWGETVYVKPDDNGAWTLGGKTQQQLSARAYSVQVLGK